MLKLVVLNLLRRKARTALSLLAITVGVSAMISMVSLIDGLYSNVSDALAQIQGVIVMQDGAASPLFSRVDESHYNKLASIPGVKTVAPTIIGIARSIDGKATRFEFGSIVRLIGTDYSKGRFDTAAGIGGEIVEGRSLKPGDKGKVVIGKEIKERYNKFVGNKIKINGKSFQIVGVYETGSKLLNSGVLFPIEDLRELLAFPKEKVTQFNLQLINPEDDEKVVSQINFRYAGELKAFSASQFSGVVSQILDEMRLLVLGVTAISAIVAAVGIINTMMMSVAERFREIGVLKAVGWTPWDVMKSVLMESSVLAMIGGLMGILLGVFASGYVSALLEMPALVTPWLALEALLFALTIGILAGLYPAYVASRLDPVKALHAE
jgi:putative ABC transport system permease protein